MQHDVVCELICEFLRVPNQNHSKRI